MRILTITAQKPNSTGSGVYLTELVKAFAKEGHEQAVLAGVYREDQVEFPNGVSFYPVYFKTEKLPFPIAGMSDEMPYESTVYGQMTEEMVIQFEGAFRRAVRDAAEEFRPDLVVCHHLYLVTSIVREELADYKVCGFCHNTDLRQMKKISLRREYIRRWIPKLDAVFALHEEQKKEIMEIYPVEEEKIQIAGTGYNQEVFFQSRGTAAKACPGETGQAAQTENGAAERKAMSGNTPLRLIYAGKIAEKKGVASLLKSLEHLSRKPEELVLYLAGGAGNRREYSWILELAGKSRYPVHFLGKLSQTELAAEYNKSDIFVLPSFSEGLPLTIMEAMACGCKVVVTDLPGIRPWTEANVEHAPVLFVEPPKMQNADEPVPESLERFERNLAETIEACAAMPYTGCPELGRVSWGNICKLVERIVC